MLSPEEQRCYLKFINFKEERLNFKPDVHQGLNQLTKDHDLGVIYSLASHSVAKPKSLGEQIPWARLCYGC